MTNETRVASPARRHALETCGLTKRFGRGEEPNEESLQAIRETEEFFASGEKGRFTNAHDLIEAALA